MCFIYFILIFHYLFTIYYYIIIFGLCLILALSYSAFNIGIINYRGSIDQSLLFESDNLDSYSYYNTSIHYWIAGSWYLDSISIIFSILLLLVLLLISYLILFSIDLYSLAAVKLEVIGTQWYWYYYYSSSIYSWFVDYSIYAGSYDYLISYLEFWSLAQGSSLIYAEIPNDWEQLFILSYYMLLTQSNIIYYYLFYYYSIITQSLESTVNYYSPWSHLSIFDSNIFLCLNQSLLLFISSFDVIHSFGINALSIRIDAVPGRLNNIFYYYLLANGVNKGYCYELCGIGHYSMQIKIIIIWIFNRYNIIDGYYTYLGYYY